MSLFTATLENGYGRPGAKGMAGLLLAAILCMIVPVFAFAVPIITHGAVLVAVIPMVGLPGWLLKIDLAALIIALAISFVRDMWQRPFFPSFLIMALACCAGITGGFCLYELLIGMMSGSGGPDPQLLLLALAAAFAVMGAAAIPAERKWKSALVALGAYCGMSIMWCFMMGKVDTQIAVFVAMFGFGCLFCPRMALAVCAVPFIILAGATGAGALGSWWMLSRK